MAVGFFLHHRMIFQPGNISQDAPYVKSRALITNGNVTMTLSALGLFAAAIFILAISPGPTAVALVARVISHGGISVLPFTAALWIGEVFFFTAAVLGLSALLSQFAWALTVIKWAGVCYLAFLAYRLWLDMTVAQGPQPTEPTSPIKLFLAGLAVTFTNAKVIAFYLALLPAVVDFAHISFASWLELTLVLISVLAAIDLGYIALAEIARRRLGSLGHTRILNKCSALALAGAALLIAAQ
jgi:threonine/homoserine/homoserine lactone efflux protein